MSSTATRSERRGSKLLAAAMLAASLMPDTMVTANGAPLEFVAVSDMDRADMAASLLGGDPVNPDDYPASFYSRSGSKRCTSTLVAARVLLTAAHCVPDGGEVKIEKAGTAYTGTCARAGEYSSNRTADWALCLLTQPVAGVPYENINQDASRLKKDEMLLLTGYGCTKKDGSGADDVYRSGGADITELPNGSSHDVVTKGQVALCFGDSGGPAFLAIGTTGKGRVTVSTNSRANINDVSKLSSLSTAAATTFLKDWSDKNKVELCGVHPGAAGCRALD